jgi:hypothetical protein
VIYGAAGGGGFYGLGADSVESTGILSGFGGRSFLGGLGEATATWTGNGSGGFGGGGMGVNGSGGGGGGYSGGGGGSGYYASGGGGGSYLTDLERFWILDGYGERYPSLLTLAVSQQDGNGIASIQYDPLIPVPVPEPGSWAMLVAGFGLTGAALRRRRMDQSRVIAIAAFDP